MKISRLFIALLLAALCAALVGCGSGDGSVNLRIEGDVTAVNTAAGTVTVLGVPVSVTATTEVRDNSSVQQRPFTLADVAVGDHLEIDGSEGAGTVLANRLERRNQNNRAILQWKVTAKTPNTSFVILGVTITVDPAVTRFEDVNDNEISASAFFDRIVPNVTVVKARWEPFSSVALPPKEVEIEN